MHPVYERGQGKEVSCMKRKGTTPLIAIILLMMMVVAVAGLAYVWVESVAKNYKEVPNIGENYYSPKVNSCEGIEIVNVTDNTKIEIDYNRSFCTPEWSGIWAKINLTTENYTLLIVRNKSLALKSTNNFNLSEQRDWWNASGEVSN